MRARIFDDTVVATLDRPAAGNGDDRVCVDTGGNRGRGHRLQDRVVWRHAEQAARSEVTRIDLEVRGIPRKFDAGLDNARRESKKSSQELGDRKFGEIAAAMRCGNEDDAPSGWHWLDEDGLPQQFAPLRRESGLVERLVGDGIPHLVAGIDNHGLSEEAALAVSDDYHLRQRRVV